MEQQKSLRGFLLFLACLFVIVVVGIVSFSPSSKVNAQANRVVLRNGDLFTVSETLGEKPLATNKDVKILFDQKNGNVLFGKGMILSAEQSPYSFGMDLWFYDAKTSSAILLNSGAETTDAMFGKDSVFFRTRSQDLFSINTDGSGKKILQSKVLSPAISNDGAKMVYQKLPADWKEGDYFDSALGLTVLDLAGNSEKRVSENPADWGALFSPDSKKIVFVSTNEDGISSFFSMNADGGARIELTNLKEKNVGAATVPAPSEQPVFSPDGKSLIYESDKAVWILRLNADLTQVVSAKKIAYGSSPQFLENGKTISVLAAPANGAAQGLIKVDLDGNLVK